MTREVKNQILAKEKAWRRLKARKTSLRAQKYRHERNLATAMIRLAKKAFEKKLCKDIKINPKHFWGYIRSKTNLKECVMRIRKRNGLLTKNDEETANEFNTAFYGVFVQENLADVPDFDTGKEVQ